MSIGVITILFLLSSCAPSASPPRTSNELLNELEPFYKVFKPNSPPPYPTVMLFHGAQITAWRSDIEKIKDVFLEQNYAAVFVDSYANRGIGGKDLVKWKLLPKERAGDLFVTLGWLRNQSWCDKNQIVAWGQSHGAATIIDSLVLFSQNKTPSSLNSSEAISLDGLKAAILFFPWCQDRFMGVELIKAVENDWTLSLPILAILPGKDKYQSLCTEILKRQLAKGHPIEIINYPNAHHSFSVKEYGPSKPNSNYNPEISKKAYDAVRNFLTKIENN